MQVSHAEERLKIAKDNLDTLSEENEQLKQRCEVLATELGTLLDNERETEQQFIIIWKAAANALAQCPQFLAMYIYYYLNNSTAKALMSNRQ